jgi:hypothetical protein
MIGENSIKAGAENFNQLFEIREMPKKTRNCF